MLISKKEALIHLVIAREINGHLDFNEKFENYESKEMSELKKYAHLEDKRFHQCFEDPDAECYYDDIPVNMLYNKYFCKRDDEWKCGFIVEFAKNSFDKERVKNIRANYENPRIIVVKLKNEEVYNVLDGMHRCVAFIKRGALIIPVVVIHVKRDFK